jgi:hypothetical protein
MNSWPTFCASDSRARYCCAGLSEDGLGDGELGGGVVDGDAVWVGAGAVVGAGSGAGALVAGVRAVVGDGAGADEHPATRQQPVASSRASRRTGPSSPTPSQRFQAQSNVFVTAFFQLT